MIGFLTWLQVPWHDWLLLVAFVLLVALAAAQVVSLVLWARRSWASRSARSETAAPPPAADPDAALADAYRWAAPVRACAMPARAEAEGQVDAWADPVAAGMPAVLEGFAQLLGEQPPS